MNLKIIKRPKEDHPIIFSTPMVQAILAGRKTMTRRVVKNQSSGCPYGDVGDRLWVRETFSTIGLERTDLPCVYKADVKNPDKFKGWKPSIHMRKEYARIFLNVKSIKVERVQAISATDVKKEGVQYRVKSKGKDMVSVLWLAEENGAFDFMPDGWRERKLDQDEILLAHWAELWCKINGRKSWDANPWVWVVEFVTVITPEWCKIENYERVK